MIALVGTTMVVPVHALLATAAGSPAPGPQTKTTIARSPLPVPQTTTNRQTLLYIIPLYNVACSFAVIPLYYLLLLQLMRNNC